MAKVLCTLRILLVLFAFSLLLWELTLLSSPDSFRADGSLESGASGQGQTDNLRGSQRRVIDLDWRDWRPEWSGKVDADERGYGSHIWQDLQYMQAATANDAAEKLLLAADGSDAPLSVLQVGACDGAWESTNDPVQALLRQEHVHALVFEPVPPLWKELDKRLSTLPNAHERLLAVNSAVCLESQQSVPFFVVSSRFAKDHPNTEHWAQRELGSFDRKHLKKHKIPDEYVETIQVKCMTPLQSFDLPSSPIGHQPSGVDALIVDAEGLDGALVDSFLAVQSFRPSLVIFEQKHLKRAILEPVLRKLEQLRYVHWRDKDQIVAVLAAPLIKAEQ